MKAKRSKGSRAPRQKRGGKLSGAGSAFPVFLIEDNRDLSDSLATMLSAQGLSVLATARNGPEALAQVARLKPKIVLVDAALGDRGSLSLVKAVRKASPGIKVIVMHLATGHRDVISFVRAGVSGFIMKAASPAEFVRTIRLV
ncbi:MAG TPA: response regulator transcription factor, partial [Vicinamibacterales bacterium]|nr:response regulator transcription factor [Vicinamibacterales bacterium]